MNLWVQVWTKSSFLITVGVSFIFGTMHIFWKWHSTANQSYCHNNSALQTRFLFGYNMKGEQRLSFKLSLQEKTGPIKFSLNQDFIKERDLTNHLVNIFSRHKIWLSDHFIMCYLFKCTLTQLQFCFCKIFCFPYKLLKRILKISVCD